MREMPEGFGTAVSAGTSTLYPIGTILFVVCVLYIFSSSRKNAYLPFFALMCLISPVQRIVVAGVDFNFFRLALLALCVRVVIRSEHNFFKLVNFDKIFLAYATSYSLIYIISSGAIGDPLGQYADLLMLYFSARCLIRKTDDVQRIFKLLAFLSFPVGVMFCYEGLTGRNLFSVFGGVADYAAMREGRFRSQGPYPHPIIAGCFWALLFPVFVGLYIQLKQKLYLVAAGFSILIVIATASSTPLMAIIAAPVFLLLYKIRRHVKKLFYLGLLGLFLLHMVMEAPVWHLLSRVTAVGGSTSYFRFQLVDAFIRHVDEWFFLGTNYTGHWFWGAQDVPNQFVLVGVRGGILAFSLFLLMIYYFYKNIYAATRISSNKVFIWSIGSALSVACVSFIGVAYFGQPVYLFFVLFPVALNVLLYERYLVRVSTRKAEN